LKVVWDYIEAILCFSPSIWWSN